MKYNNTGLVTLICLLLLSLHFSCQNNGNIDGLTQGSSALTSDLVWKPGQQPAISAHRGGPSPGYPENCVETFQHTIASIPAIIECDINITKDGHLVLMHDNKVDRTSSGTGYVDELDLTTLKSFSLQDETGNVTKYKIPTLEEALIWAKGKTILSLDVKRGVPFKKVVEMIEAQEAINNVTVIVYTVKSALEMYRLNSKLKISARIRNKDEYMRLSDAGIPDKNLVAFTGLRALPSAHYQLLHDKGILCIIGAIGNIDRRAERRGDGIYAELVKSGVDIIATDRPLEVAKTLGLSK